ncbi:MAG TPA: serine hydrolase domain-containing protein [Candidatus Binataceae bacterium]
MAVKIEGTCDPKFKRVRDVFAGHFERGLEVGASVALTIDGKPVVDLWAGHADEARTRPWTRDTLVNVYSTTKGFGAVCAHRLVDKGLLDLDAPVARYWPEFAQAGKDKIPVRMVLNHQAGLPAIKKALPFEAVFQWDTMCAALAAQEPWWVPGTKHGYHALTYSWLVGELVRRASGKSPGTYFRDEIAAPLGLDAHVGLDPKNDARTATIVPAPPTPPGEKLGEGGVEYLMQDPESMAAKAISNPPLSVVDPKLISSRAWRAAELFAVNGHATAWSLARLYGALARGGELDGYRVLERASIPRCYTVQSEGPDAVLGAVTRFAVGFALSTPNVPLGPNPHSFGHPGAGGSIGFADPVANLGFGYTMNKMGASALVDARAMSLYGAVFESL